MDSLIPTRVTDQNLVEVLMRKVLLKACDRSIAVVIAVTDDGSAEAPAGACGGSRIRGGKLLYDKAYRPLVAE